MIFFMSFFLDKINFLGISIVGQANKKGDGGIYVGSVMKGLVSYYLFNSFHNTS